jgi:hypothetical protein
VRKKNLKLQDKQFNLNTPETWMRTNYCSVWLARFDRNAISVDLQRFCETVIEEKNETTKASPFLSFLFLFGQHP